MSHAEAIAAYYDNANGVTHGSALHQAATGFGIRTDTVGNKMDNLACYPRTDATQYDAIFDGV